MSGKGNHKTIPPETIRKKRDEEETRRETKLIVKKGDKVDRERRQTKWKVEFIERRTVKDYGYFEITLILGHCIICGLNVE